MKKIFDEIKWRDIMAEISTNVTEVSYRTWFLPISPLEIDEEAAVMYVASSNDFLINIINTRYISIFEQSVETILGKKYKVVIKNMSDEEIENHLKKDNSKKIETSIQEQENNEFKEEYFLNPKYNFDNFIVGENNRYAHAVALAVAENPASTYNPLFIYGDSGLGKTHLMHAIGHYIMENSPNKKVLYVSSEMFTSELIKAIQDKKNPTQKKNLFRSKYRNIDVLLRIDNFCIIIEDKIDRELGISK